MEQQTQTAGNDDIQETRRKNIPRMLSKKKYSYKEISEINDATIEEVKELEMQLC